MGVHAGVRAEASRVKRIWAAKFPLIPQEFHRDFLRRFRTRVGVLVMTPLVVFSFPNSFGNRVGSLHLVVTKWWLLRRRTLFGFACLPATGRRHVRSDPDTRYGTNSTNV